MHDQKQICKRAQLPFRHQNQYLDFQKCQAGGLHNSLANTALVVACEHLRIWLSFSGWNGTRTMWKVSPWLVEYFNLFFTIFSASQCCRMNHVRKVLSSLTALHSKQKCKARSRKMPFLPVVLPWNLSFSLAAVLRQCLRLVTVLWHSKGHTQAKESPTEKKRASSVVSSLVFLLQISSLSQGGKQYPTRWIVT